MRKVLLVLSLALQLGYMIALPAVILAFGGGWLDRQLGTSPLFILLGLALAILASSLWVWKFIQRVEK
ncbi:AtpZ/AtpI family protein [Candidatus Berkelbacteria bacterium]|nr:AtpZ/AtpI family protein [Candidatus Berkelbacteria bacterium]